MIKALFRELEFLQKVLLGKAQVDSLGSCFSHKLTRPDWDGRAHATRGAGLRADGVCAEPPSAGAPPSRRAPSVTADTHNLPQSGLVSLCEKQLPREST